MTLQTWLRKVKRTLSRSSTVVVPPPPPHPHPHPNKKSAAIKKSNVGVLAFEVASVMSKLLHLWQSLSENNFTRLQNQVTSLEGLRKIVSNDDSLLLTLACAEMVQNLRVVSKSVSRLSKKCEDSNLRAFDRFLNEFADSGIDTNNWVLSMKDMELKCKKMEAYVSSTALLQKEMEELTVLENGLRKSIQLKVKEEKIIEIKQRILSQRQEIQDLKQRTLWCRSFDGVTNLLARSIFTTLDRIKTGFFEKGNAYPACLLPRSLSSSAAIHPSEKAGQPLMMKKDSTKGFFELNSKLLKPPSSTLGAAALALHYSNLIIVMEKMIRSPQLVGLDARDDLYSMLPKSVRTSLRGRLKGSVGFAATDPVLAAEWREALQKIMGWLSPLAHNMIRWQSERSFEQKRLIPKSNVLLCQTLYFANQEKAEAAITELLVGLNYIWRFEREMNAKALFESLNFQQVFESSTL